MPEAGPTLLVAGGRLTVTVPSRPGGYNRWVSVFQAPALTAPALPGDWDLDAGLLLAKAGPGTNSHFGLAALISDRHVVNWGQLRAPEFDGPTHRGDHRARRPRGERSAPT